MQNGVSYHGLDIVQACQSVLHCLCTRHLNELHWMAPKRSTLHSLADIFNQTPLLLLEASSHAAINVRRLLIHKYPPQSIAWYSFIQLSELRQCWLNKLAQDSTRSTGFKHGFSALRVQYPSNCDPQWHTGTPKTFKLSDWTICMGCNILNKWCTRVYVKYVEYI